MDCNRDEAVRAKEIALKMFSDKDIIGATKFALKAQKLYPELEGISHLVANMELHMSTMFKRNGEIDWYRMLGVYPSADRDTISKQYRKLALLVHPDKNREVGSESAFKLLSEAFRVLKDDDARSAYDQRTSVQQFQQNNYDHGQFVPVFPTQAAQTGSFHPATTNWSQFRKGYSNSSAQPSGNSASASADNGMAQQKHPDAGLFSRPPPCPPKRAKKSDNKRCYSNSSAQPSWNSASASADNGTAQQKHPDAGVFSRPPPCPPKRAKKSDNKRSYSNSSAQPNWNSASASADNGTAQQKHPDAGVFSRPPPCPPKRAKKSYNKRSSSKSTREVQKKITFWTSCSGCKMRFEYLLMCRNKYLYCLNCRTAFKAVAIPTPSIWVKSNISYSYSRTQNPSQATKVSDAGNFKSNTQDSAATQIYHSDANDSNLKSKKQKLDGKSTMIRNGNTSNPNAS